VKVLSMGSKATSLFAVVNSTKGPIVERSKILAIWLATRTAVLVMIVGLTIMNASPAYTKETELLSIGIRGGINSDTLGIPPTEKEDFEQYDVFAVVGSPWSWDFPSGWDIRFRLNIAAGTLRAAGDSGFIGELSPGIAFSKPSWRFTFDIGGGPAYLSQEKYGRQDIGGPVQIIGHGGITYHLPWKTSVGYRFHHMSDAAIYGNNNRGVDLHMLELSYRF
jgi:hypothetical protein